MFSGSIKGGGVLFDIGSLYLFILKILENVQHLSFQLFLQICRFLYQLVFSENGHYS